MPRTSVFDMQAAKVLPLLKAKALKKGRTEDEFYTVVEWLLGYSPAELEDAVTGEMTYGDFFRAAPAPNPNRTLITGKVCGVRVEEIEDPLMRDMRCLDKLVDELAKGRSLDKILCA